MNIIQKIQMLLLSFILSSSIIISICGFSNFIQNQNLDNYFLQEDVYNFSDDLFLIKNEINLCGEKYYPGDMVEKETYEYCKK